MKDGIDWTEVGAGGRFEKIVSTLLSTLHPESERIDGAGGDGGRDHQLRSDDRHDLWQSKYFLRRLSESPTRKGQVTESLQTAARLRPDSWTLVTPMVPTPGERAWFDELASEYPFPVVWRGGDWLDAQLALYPAIRSSLHERQRRVRRVASRAQTGARSARRRAARGDAQDRATRSEAQRLEPVLRYRLHGAGRARDEHAASSQVPRCRTGQSGDHAVHRRGRGRSDRPRGTTAVSIRMG